MIAGERGTYIAHAGRHQAHEPIYKDKGVAA